MAHFPKRWANICRTCGYIWHPKGHGLSIKCPRCQSTNVDLVGFGCLRRLSGCGWVIIIVFGLFILRLCTGPSTPSVPATASNSPYASNDVAGGLQTPFSSQNAPGTQEVRRALPVDRTTPIPSAAAFSYSVVGIARNDTLNVRSGPGATHSVVARLTDGTSGVQVMGASVMNGTTEWVPINYRGQTGWVTKEFLKPN